MAVQRLIPIDEAGRVELPEDIRTRLDIKTGDLVTMTELNGGVILLPRIEAVRRALDEVGAALLESGATLDDMLESGREIRGELLKERYGISAPDESV